jgi:hypothetical protein
VYLFWSRSFPLFEAVELVGSMLELDGVHELLMHVLELGSPELQLLDARDIPFFPSFFRLSSIISCSSRQPVKEPEGQGLGPVGRVLGGLAINARWKLEM